MTTNINFWHNTCSFPYDKSFQRKEIHQLSKMEPTSFHILNLSKPKDYSEENVIGRRLAEKHREIRLLGLKASPEAFSSKYEEVAQRPLSSFAKSLFGPTVDQFIALDRAVPEQFDVNNDEHVEVLLSAQWIGMLVLTGPAEDSKSATGSQDPSLPTMDPKHETSVEYKAKPSVTEPLSLELNGFFVDPRARRLGVGKALVGTALAKGEATARRLQTNLECIVLVYATNEGARRFYEKAGFRVTGDEIRYDGRTEKVVQYMSLSKPLPQAESNMDSK